MPVREYRERTSDIETGLDEEVDVKFKGTSANIFAYFHQRIKFVFVSFCQGKFQVLN